MGMNGAETLVKTLLASGVTTCFANPGTSEMHFVAALDTHPDMRCILCLFEGGATGAADGYFRMTGDIAATLLHLAPGFANGWANLHNAKKARSGVLTIMGDHASHHLQYESPLRGDTVGISQAVSHWTRVCADAGSVAQDGADAVRVARSNGGQIATLILPANTAWDKADASAVAADPPALRRPSMAAVQAAAEVLQRPGAALMVDGLTLHTDLGDVASRIAARTGCHLMAPYFVARMRRGGGTVPFQRLRYPVDENVALLADKTALVLCGAVRPVSFFAYPGKPSLPEAVGAHVMELCAPDMDYAWALKALADALGVRGPLPLQALDLPALPTGTLTVAKVGAAMAHLMPEDVIVVDEAITAARPVIDATMGARPHDLLCLMGGAIGHGLPVAVGAAVGAPDRKVVVWQADGSAMYTVQSLWTMAREGLDVTVVVFANRGYQILRGELANVGVRDVGRNAQRMFDVENPTLDWVSLARGHGVSGVRVTDMAGFNAAFADAMGRRGPMLIEVVC
jgi:acetolactate synthase I/II/III large subunit